MESEFDTTTGSGTTPSVLDFGLFAWLPRSGSRTVHLVDEDTLDGARERANLLFEPVRAPSVRVLDFGLEEVHVHRSLRIKHVPGGSSPSRPADSEEKERDSLETLSGLGRHSIVV